MTPARFVACIGAVAPPGFTDEVTRAARDLGLDLVFQAERLMVWTDPAAAIPIRGRRGVVVGSIFERKDGAYPKAKAVTIATAAGDDLFGAYWGGYAAFLIDPSDHGVRVLRDPSGSVGCCFSRKAGVDVVFSDAAAAHDLGLIAKAPNPFAVAHHLTFGGLMTERTGLDGVLEVLPGTSVRLDGVRPPTRRCSWTPWTFAAKDAQIADRHEAIERVRRETQVCVAAWASQYGSVLHELSGGLDSSIVAACVAEQDCALACVNAVTPDPGADERVYARQVADRIRAPLFTVMLDFADSDPKGLAEPLSARPGSGMLHQVLDRALTRQGQRTGADVFFSGGGGDNIFCYLTSAAPAADALRQHGLGSVFLQGVRDLAALHRCTVWRAGRLAVRKAWQPPKSWPRTPDFLAKSATPLAPDPHPWLAAPGGAPPGKQEHIHALMATHHPLAVQARHGRTPVCHPLLSQPLIELCLRVPSWMWIAGGRDRAIAREAFKDRLPLSVLQRRTKGDFTGFLGALYAGHRTEFAGLLLDGWLAANHLIDRPAVEAYLKSVSPVTDNRFARLMDLANAELWARSWLARSPARRRT